ncbi:MAG TPA: MBOAT family O-acyltransferase [Rhodocyclaceae bacterium]|nr:MBOAT family O-acyltransferase [Rhodocyclaceae bacterium]
MLFNSYEFIFCYLPLVLGLFFVIGRWSRKLAALWLAAASIFFYGWWDARYVFLLLLSITVNFGIGYLIGTSRGRRRRTALLTAGVAANLAGLAVYKYADFFLNSVNGLAGAAIPLLELILPLGISFFTFTQIAFLVDVYRKEAKEYDFIHYLLFVSYFPHLIAGPVLHHKQMMPQFARPETYRFSADALSQGLSIFTFGLVKKVLIADQFAAFADPVFTLAAGGDTPSSAMAWAGALAYTLQLYFDFSGYSDMAIGLSRMFNIDLPINFDSPYKATSIIDFWRRWHITLSTFLRDYLYIPLGGNRYGSLRRHANLLTTMVLGGLWHGANWTFVLWGTIHGLYLVLNHGWDALKARCGWQKGLPGPLPLVLTFLLVVVAWVPFRADSIDTALRMLRSMFGLYDVASPAFSGGPVKLRTAFNWIAVGLAIVWLMPNTQQVFGYGKAAPAGKALVLPILGRRIGLAPAWAPNRLWAASLGLALGYVLLNVGKVSPFLYFQF